MGSSGGSELLLPLSERLRLPIEQVNFAMCQLFGLFTAFLFRNYLHPSKTNHIIRHVVATLLGLHFAFFCFGSYTVYFLGEVILLYCVMVTVHMKRIHKYSFLIAMAYLTMCQIIRVYWFDGKERSADFSGPLMVITQKVTKLAFELRDGLTRDESELSTSQKRLAVRRIPSLLEYLSYNLNFMGILAGPLNSYNDYISFIEGRNFEVGMNHPAIGKKSNKCPPNEPSSLGAVGCKILICTVCVFMHLYLLDVFPISYNTDRTFIATASIPVRLLYLYISSLACRPKYYFAWTIADAVNNAAGFGFTGYDSRGKPCWDLFSNLNIVKVEFATSMKMFIDNWNIQTALWLKEVCYDRCPFNPTLSTFLLSAIWHGVYPGYYFTFITGTIMTLAARAVRNNLRPYFLGSSTYKMFYDVMTWATTQVVVSYTVVPFVLPFLSSSFEFYSHWNGSWALKKMAKMMSYCSSLAVVCSLVILFVVSQLMSGMFLLCFCSCNFRISGKKTEDLVLQFAYSCHGSNPDVAKKTEKYIKRTTEIPSH